VYPPHCTGNIEHKYTLKKLKICEYSLLDLTSHTKKNPLTMACFTPSTSDIIDEMTSIIAGLTQRNEELAAENARLRTYLPCTVPIPSVDSKGRATADMPATQDPSVEKSPELTHTLQLFNEVVALREKYAVSEDKINQQNTVIADQTELAQQRGAEINRLMSIISEHASVPILHAPGIVKDPGYEALIARAKANDESIARLKETYQQYESKYNDSMARCKQLEKLLCDEQAAHNHTRNVLQSLDGIRLGATADRDEKQQNEEINNLKEHLKHTRSKIKQLKGEIEGLSDETRRARNEICVLKDDICCLQKEIDSGISTRVDLQRQLKLAMSEIAKYKGINEKLADDLSKVRSQLIATDQCYGQAISDRNEKQRNIDKQNKEIEELKDQAFNGVCDNDQLQDEITKYKELNEKLAIELSHAESKHLGTTATLQSAIVNLESRVAELSASTYCKECGENTRQHIGRCIQCAFRQVDCPVTVFGQSADIIRGYQEVIGELTAKLAEAYGMGKK
jgi:DNA repair exonuclease SbcCD ATPase subunit